LFVNESTDFIPIHFSGPIRAFVRMIASIIQFLTLIHIGIYFEKDLPFTGILSAVAISTAYNRLLSAIRD
jgi:hypothetical protein